MNLLSMNIRGFESGLKQSRIREVCFSKKVNFLGLQETMVSSISLMQISLFWGNYNFDSVYQSSVGKSGGIISIWDPVSFVKNNVFSGEGYLVVIGDWVNPSKPFGFINVYAPQQLSLKRSLWSNLINIIKGDMNRTWVVFGDFNEVRFESERKGSRFSASGARYFNQFVSEAGLFEVCNGARKFSRFSSDGSKLSKIDRIMVTHNFFDTWLHPNVEILSRSYSDHCPLLLKSFNADFGPPPFRFFNSWLSECSLQEVVSKCWQINISNYSSISPMARYQIKIKHLKNCLKTWRQKLKANKGLLPHLKSELDKLDIKAEEDALSVEDHASRADLKCKIYEMEKKELLDIQQKARLNWAITGDENSKYYHNTLKRNHRRNFIHGLSHNGVWVTDSGEVKRLFFEFFA